MRIMRGDHMNFRLTQTEYDRKTERAYVELRADDDDGGEIFAVAVFSYRSRSKLTRGQIEQEVVRKARHALKRAGSAI
jgi:hypothetical protein